MPGIDSLIQTTAREGIRQGFTLVMAVVLIGLLLIVCLLLYMALRRARRMRERLSERLRGGAGLDPWREAGRRAEPETKYITLGPDGAEVAGDAPGGVAEPTEQETLGPIGGERPIAVVTGGARRVGKAICESLAKAGCDLVVTYNTSVAAARETALELTKMGAAVRLVRLALEDPDAVERTGAMLARDLPRCDVLVHNASVYGATPLDLVSAETAQLFWRVNTLAPLLLTKRLAGRLSESTLPGGGAVVAMVDIHAAGRPRKEFALYSMSKAALAEMVQTLARELAPKVRVNAVAPGVVAWPEAGLGSDVAAQEAYLKNVPLERAGTPQEAAEAVRWLAMDAHYTTGQIVRVDGGRFLS